MPPSSTGSGSASRTRRRAVIGTVVLVVLVALAGLAAYLTRDDRHSFRTSAPQETPVSSSSASTGASPPPKRPGVLPAPPSTRDPIAFGKAAAVALWSYDTRVHSQPELLSALRTWLTGETEYADAVSVEALVPSPVLWGRMADNGQYATAVVNEAHFPDAFTRALQANPEAINQAYVYAVTVSGRQSIGWRGSPAGGAEVRTTTLAIQCRPSQSCALAGVLPTAAP
ncbi:hypothetical protein ACWEFL_20580 [Streptomyces sp. NPDC004838]